MISDLVGLKWQDNELDCVRLMIKAQRELWNRNIYASKEYQYSRDNIKEASQKYHRRNRKDSVQGRATTRR